MFSLTTDRKYYKKRSQITKINYFPKLCIGSLLLSNDRSWVVLTLSEHGVCISAVELSLRPRLYTHPATVNTMPIIFWLTFSAAILTTQGAMLLAPTSVANASPCDGSDWSACRTAFADAVFGEKVVPRAPDFVFPRPDYLMSGLPGPGNGTGVGSVCVSLFAHWAQSSYMSLSCRRCLCNH